MTTPAERLAAAIHMESAAIAPQTSPLIEAAKEVLKENERLRAAMVDASAFIKKHDSGKFSDRLGAVYKIDSLIQQLSVNSEEGK